MGYGFAQRTIGKRVDELRDEMKEREDACDRRIDSLITRLEAAEKRVREVEDRYMSGMERQLAQSRESGLQLIDRGVIRPSAASRHITREDV